MIAHKKVFDKKNNVIPFDIILVSGDYYADHPHSGVGIISRNLEHAGYSVGIIEKPDWKKISSFLVLGLPRLFFGVSSGLVDSMLQNYTPLKKKRAEDPYSPYESNVPDRAIIIYCQKIKEAMNWAQKNWELQQLSHIKLNKIPIVIGGVEASLRRFTHFDYWDNKIRKPILLDSKADILVYGPGEYQIIEIAQRISHIIDPNGLNIYDELKGIEGTVLLSPSPPNSVSNKNFEALPSYQMVLDDKKEFCKMHLAFSNQKNLYQLVGNRYVIQFRCHNYTTKELDDLYSLPFSYKIPDKYKALKMAEFSIITHRGCFGNCNFCSIKLHQGEKIISRSQGNILREIERISKLPHFKGYIGDLGGPSANMYGMDCNARENCQKNCIDCKQLNRSHQPSIDLLRNPRKLPKIKKIFVRSGIRYDLAVEDDTYIEEISKYHISGSLKIAPEHFSPVVCQLLNKPNEKFQEFKEKFDAINAPLNQSLKYYFITAHPGSTMKEAYELRVELEKLGFHNTESIQIFTPTPMSISTCMYYTGLNPYTLKPIYVPYSYIEKKKQKRILYEKNDDLNKNSSLTKGTPNKRRKGSKITRI